MFPAQSCHVYITLAPECQATWHVSEHDNEQCDVLAKVSEWRMLHEEGTTNNGDMVHSQWLCINVVVDTQDIHRT